MFMGVKIFPISIKTFYFFTKQPQQLTQYTRRAETNEKSKKITQISSEQAFSKFR